jgi:methyl-accepting chemotaxis protein
MSSLFGNLKIGPKFALSIGAVAVAVIAVGLVILYKQEQDKLELLLEQRGKLLETQIQITRSYISQNYVGKLKKSKAGSDIVVAKDHVNNPDAIPFPATATREMGEEANKSGLFGQSAQRSVRNRRRQGDYERRRELFPHRRGERRPDLSSRLAR